jgi:hypothetical protein
MPVPNLDEQPPERDKDEPTVPGNSPGLKGPLMMYISMVTAFLIIAVFVIHYVLNQSATTR